MRLSALRARMGEAHHGPSGLLPQVQVALLGHEPRQAADGKAAEETQPKEGREMSTDEQLVAIGRLSVERAEARREAALLESEVEKIRQRLMGLSTLLSYLSEPAKIEAAISHAEGMIAAGGLDRLRQSLAELVAAKRRAADIGQTLRNAGAE